MCKILYDHITTIQFNTQNLGGSTYVYIMKKIRNRSSL